MSDRRSSLLSDVKRRLAETIVRSKIDHHDDLRVLEVLWNKHQIEEMASASKISELWRKPVAPHLYLNIPFCRQKCTFCKFPVTVGISADQLDGYIADTFKEIEFLAPYFSAVSFQSVCVGGGTPSILSSVQMDRVLRRLLGRFAVHEDGFRSIEFHPSTATLEKLRVARNAGLRRVSFGVQTMNAGLLKRVERDDQTTPNVVEALRRAREAGFDEISAELILGLVGQTAGEFIDSIDQLMRERPSSISINQLNLTEYYMQTENLRPEEYFAQRRKIIEEVCGRLPADALRHEFDADHISPTRGIWTLRDKRRPRSPYELGNPHGPAWSSTLGIGQSAWSHIVNRAWYERSRAPFDPDEPLYRLRMQTLEREAAKYVHYQLINSSFVGFSEFESAFGVSLLSQYELELKLLELFGKIRVDGSGVRFLPTQMTERFFFGSMFFLRQWASMTAGLRLLSPGILGEWKAELLSNGDGVRAALK